MISAFILVVISVYVKVNFISLKAVNYSQKQQPIK
jgi:hypothetical protein